MSSLKGLRERRGQLHHQFKKIVDRSEKEDRDLTAEENAILEKNHADDLKLAARIATQEKLDAKTAELNEPAYSPLNGRGRGSAAGAVPDGGDGARAAHRLSFKNEATGEKVHALLPHERLSVEARHEDDDDGDIDVGRLIAAKLTGKIDNLTEREFKNLGSSDGSGGTLFAPSVASTVLDLARSASVCMAAGCQTMVLDGPEHSIVTLLSDATSTWRHPGQVIPQSDMTFGRIVFRPKTLGVVIPIQIETIEDAANLPSVVSMALSASMGLAVDQAIIGTGAVDPARPLGLLATAGTNAIGGVGTPSDYSQLVTAIADILGNNYPGPIGDLAWLSHSRDGATYANLQDTLHQPLRKPDWVAQLKELHTTSFPTNGGGGSNESQMIVGAFGTAVLGARKSLTIRVLDSGSVTVGGVTFDAAASLQKLIVAYLRVDVAFLRPSWFTVLSNVTA